MNLDWSVQHTHSRFVSDVMTHVCRNFNGSLTQLLSELWHYISLFYVDVITYPFPNLNAGFTKIC